jgi:hypothetical protein
VRPQQRRSAHQVCMFEVCVTRSPRLCNCGVQTAKEQRDFCTAAQIISPNEAEAVSMVRVAARAHKIASQSAHRAIPLAQVGPAPPRELVARLAAAGARVVALRRGPEGAIVHWCAHVRFFVRCAPAHTAAPCCAARPRARPGTFPAWRAWRLWTPRAAATHFAAVSWQVGGQGSPCSRQASGCVLTSCVAGMRARMRDLLCEV